MQFRSNTTTLLLVFPIQVKQRNMFNIFKRKSELEKLQEKYAKLQKESYDLSKTDRSASDRKQAEAHEIQKRIGELM